MNSKQDTIFLVHYDPKWKEMFASEKSNLEKSIGDKILSIHHIGSTAVHGLGGKPIIDIMVAVNKLEAGLDLIVGLEKLDYHYESNDSTEKRLFFRKGMPRTHHLHIVEKDSFVFQKHLVFRDYLRTHPNIAAEYFTIKQEMAEKFHDNRTKYVEGKRPFIDKIVVQAMEENQ